MMRLAILCKECHEGFVVETPDDRLDLGLVGNHTGLQGCDCGQLGRRPWLVMVEDRCRSCDGHGAQRRAGEPVRACTACGGTGRLVRDDGSISHRAWNPTAPACDDTGGCVDCRAFCRCQTCDRRAPGRLDTCTHPVCTRDRCPDDPPPLKPAQVDRFVQVACDPTPVIVVSRPPRWHPARLLSRALYIAGCRFQRLGERLDTLLTRWASVVSRRVPQAPCRGCGRPGAYVSGFDAWECEECGETPF